MLTNYKEWTTDELLKQLQSNRVVVFNRNNDNTVIVEILETRMKEMKEVMYND
jgi:hypothetical protein